jgi:hypothetical protein
MAEMAPSSNDEESHQTIVANRKTGNDLMARGNDPGQVLSEK